MRAHCASRGVVLEQIPSGCRWIGKKPIPVRSPFDFIAARDGTVVLFDAKTVATKTFSKSACKPHQIEALARFWSAGLRAGYVVWFRPIDSVVFFGADSLKRLPQRSSLKESDGIALGGLSDLTLGALFYEGS